MASVVSPHTRDNDAGQNGSSPRKSAAEEDDDIFMTRAYPTGVDDRKLSGVLL